MGRSRSRIWSREEAGQDQEQGKEGQKQGRAGAGQEKGKEQVGRSRAGVGEGVGARQEEGRRRAGTG